ncbi:MAG: hypothetical protein DRJ50_09140 [Actinobacteria bacterium]|nr:MAG: hypothetical protein DRJ50_09140 [Actinomycetota bacterium]
MEHGDKDSIRLQGRKIAELPHRERFSVLKQIAHNDEEQGLKDILRRFPLYDIEQLKAAIRQMEGNIKRLQMTQSEEHQ